MNDYEIKCPHCKSNDVDFDKMVMCFWCLVCGLFFSEKDIKREESNG